MRIEGRFAPIDEVLDSIIHLMIDEDTALSSENREKHEKTSDVDLSFVNHVRSDMKGDPSAPSADEPSLHARNSDIYQSLARLSFDDRNHQCFSSLKTVTACRVSLKRLNDIRLIHCVDNHTTFGNMAFRLLQPLLQNWLSESLPKLVETIRLRTR